MPTQQARSVAAPPHPHTHKPSSDHQRDGSHHNTVSERV